MWGHATTLCLSHYESSTTKFSHAHKNICISTKTIPSVGLQYIAMTLKYQHDKQQNRISDISSSNCYESMLVSELDGCAYTVSSVTVSWRFHHDTSRPDPDGWVSSRCHYDASRPRPTVRHWHRYRVWMWGEREGERGQGPSRWWCWIQYTHVPYCSPQL